MDQQEPQISKEEFVEWNKSNVTKFIKEELTRQKKMYILAVRGHVRGGDYHDASRYEGLIEGLDTILDIEYEDVEDES